MERKEIIEIKSVRLEQEEEKTTLIYDVVVGGGKIWKYFLSFR